MPYEPSFSAFTFSRPVGGQGRTVQYTVFAGGNDMPPHVWDGQTMRRLDELVFAQERREKQTEAEKEQTFQVNTGLSGASSTPIDFEFCKSDADMKNQSQPWQAFESLTQKLERILHNLHITGTVRNSGGSTESTPVLTVALKDFNMMTENVHKLIKNYQELCVVVENTRRGYLGETPLKTDTEAACLMRSILRDIVNQQRNNRDFDEKVIVSRTDWRALVDVCSKL